VRDAASGEALAIIRQELKETAGGKAPADFQLDRSTAQAVAALAAE